MKVDIRAEFDDSIQEMEWEEVLEILKAAIEDVLDTPPNTPPPPPTPPPVVLPTELGQVGDVHEAHQLPDVYSQGQNNQAPVINTYQNLVPIQLLNGQWVYPYTLCSPDTIAPPAPTSMSKKRKYNKPQDVDRPYIKKPLNAFMLFMKEQRPNVVAEIKTKNNAIVNSVLGQRWASLSEPERQIFYEKAEEEKRIHASLNPGWTSSTNYGTKRKRQRRKVPTEASS